MVIHGLSSLRENSRTVSGIAPVFIEIHDNSLDVALFTKP